MDDDDFEMMTLIPQRHNRWAVIVPFTSFLANVAGDVHQLFSNYTMIAAQHGMQKHYDEKFREVTRGYSGVRSGEVFPEN